MQTKNLMTWLVWGLIWWIMVVAWSTMMWGWSTESVGAETDDLALINMEEGTQFGVQSVSDVDNCDSESGCFLENTECERCDNRETQSPECMSISCDEWSNENNCWTSYETYQNNTCIDWWQDWTISYYVDPNEGFSSIFWLYHDSEQNGGPVQHFEMEFWFKHFWPTSTATPFVQDSSSSNWTRNLWSITFTADDLFEIKRDASEEMVLYYIWWNLVASVDHSPSNECLYFAATAWNNVSFSVNSICEEDCGDGVVEWDEQCDDGNTYNHDACTNECQNNVCGDWVVFIWIEECDDGNNVDGDGCSSTCELGDIDECNLDLVFDYDNNGEITTNYDNNGTVIPNPPRGDDDILQDIVLYADWVNDQTVCEAWWWTFYPNRSGETWTCCPAGKVCDLNCDWEISTLDVVLLTKYAMWVQDVPCCRDTGRVIMPEFPDNERESVDVEKYKDSEKWSELNLR